MTPSNAVFGELFQVLALVAAAAVVAAIEHRSILDYNLRGPRRVVHFFSGIVVGFAALLGAGWLPGMGRMAALRTGQPAWIRGSEIRAHLGSGFSARRLL